MFFYRFKNIFYILTYDYNGAPTHRSKCAIIGMLYDSRRFKCTDTALTDGLTQKLGHKKRNIYVVCPRQVP